MNISYPKKLPNDLLDEIPIFFLTTQSTSKLIITTESSKIFIENNETSSLNNSIENEFNFIQISAKINAIDTIIIDGKDCLLIGTNQYIVCMDIESENTIFYKQVQDEISVVKAVNFTNNNDQNFSDPDQEIICYLGGVAGTLTGLNRLGQDIFWFVIDGSINAILPIQSPSKSFFVGTSTGRFQKISSQDNQVLSETIVSDGIISLDLLSGNLIAFTTESNTLNIIDIRHDLNENPLLIYDDSQHLSKIIGVNLVDRNKGPEGSQSINDYGAGFLDDNSVLIVLENGNLEMLRLTDFRKTWVANLNETREKNNNRGNKGTNKSKSDKHNSSAIFQNIAESGSLDEFSRSSSFRSSQRSISHTKSSGENNQKVEINLFAKPNFLIDSYFQLWTISTFDNETEFSKNKREMGRLNLNLNNVYQQKLDNDNGDKIANTYSDHNLPKLNCQIEPSAEHRAIILNCNLSLKTFIIRSISVKCPSLYPATDNHQKTEKISFGSASNSYTFILMDSFNDSMRQTINNIKNHKLHVTIEVSIKSSQVTEFHTLESDLVMKPLTFFIRYDQNQESISNLQVAESVVNTTFNQVIIAGKLENAFKNLMDDDQFDREIGKQNIYRSVFDDSALVIKILSSSTNETKIQFSGYSLPVIAYLVQFIAENCLEGNSTAIAVSSSLVGFNFDHIQESFLNKDELKQTVEKLNAEVGEMANLSKASLFHLDDSLRREDTEAMNAAISALQNFNRDLRQTSMLKFENSERLKNITSEVFGSIELACRLRYGSQSTELMKQCLHLVNHQSGKDNQEVGNELINLLRYGVIV